MGASAVAPAEVEQLGDLGDGFGAGADVAHGAAGVAVPCLRTCLETSTTSATSATGRLGGPSTTERSPLVMLVA
jgi:hypothetical protein